VLPELSCSYELHRIDFFDPSSVAECIRGADVIYHVAGATSGNSQEELDRANALTTRVMLEARERAAPDALFVLLSSLSAAGPEENGGRPIGPYGRSKLLAESIVRRSGNWVIVRPPAVFGPRDSATAPLFRLASFPGLVVTPASRESVNWLVYVDDLVELLTMLPGCARALGATLTPAYREPVTWERLVELLRRAAGKRLLWLRVPAPLVRLAGLMSEIAGRMSAGTRGRRSVVFDRYKSREFLARSWRLDLDYTEELTGWSASTPILEAFRSTLEYYKGT
jgi:nucleoside-diphosphate-sugar epimerase